MAKKMYVGVSDVARKVSKMYVGVNGVARKVKKAYIGVSGVARLFFSKGMNFNKVQIKTRYPLDETASATNTNYVLFGGGERRAQGASTTTANTTVDAFNSSLTRTACSDLTGNRSSRGASSGNYAMFGGEGTTYTSVYNTNLSKSTVNISYNQYGMPGGDTLNHCVFGVVNSNTTSSPKVVCIDKSTLSTSDATALTMSSTKIFFDPATCSRFGDDWFCFGCNTGYMQHYNKNLTKQTNVSFSSYSSALEKMGVGAMPNYLICGGGQYQSGSVIVSSVFAVDKNLTFRSCTGFTYTTASNSACGNDECCMFSTGTTNSTKCSDYNTVHVYNTNLTKSTKQASNVGTWTYGSINFKDMLFLPNGRIYTSSQMYNSGIIDVWS